jgi:hypothetical protein
MDARRDPVAKGIIHKPMAGKPVLALKGYRDNGDVEMPPAGLRALVAVVLGAVVANLD